MDKLLQSEIKDSDALN